MFHSEGEYCFCDPTIISVEKPDGSIGQVIVHNEENQTPEQLADRAACVFEAMEQIRLGL